MKPYRQDVPALAWFALGFAGLVVEELLLQQGKLLWDDLRDRQLDKDEQFRLANEH